MIGGFLRQENYTGPLSGATEWALPAYRMWHSKRTSDALPEGAVVAGIGAHLARSGPLGGLRGCLDIAPARQKSCK